MLEQKQVDAASGMISAIAGSVDTVIQGKHDVAIGYDPARPIQLNVNFNVQSGDE